MTDKELAKIKKRLARNLMLGTEDANAVMGHVESLTAALAQARREERERCAQVAYRESKKFNALSPAYMGARWVEDAIRALDENQP